MKAGGEGGEGGEGVAQVRGARAGMPLTVLTRALRVAQLLIAHGNTRRRLKVRIEAFHNAVLLRALAGKQRHTDTKARRVVLEPLTDLFADPTVSIDLFCNMDCGLESSNCARSFSST